MTEIAEMFARPHKPGPRYIIDPVAFFIALIGGPVLFTLATFWLLFIPVFALVFGGIPYLVIGTPVLLIYMRRNLVTPRKLADLAIFVLLATYVPLFVLCVIFQQGYLLGSISALWLCSLIFGPLWAASFGCVYRRMARDFYQHPFPN